MAGGLASFWEEWSIHILVILSFALQVILLCCAGIRRRGGASSALWSILLWLAYQMADYTAIYALGHMSIRMRSKCQPTTTISSLVPFWGPLLLLHLGGPDTITAYALQDNQLWLRHLLALAAQVLGAAYVLYLFVARTNPAGKLLAAAAALMFVSGCLKYGERTWALKCAGLDSILSSFSLNHSTSYYHGRPEGGEGRQELDTEEVLLGAHYMLDDCKRVLVDMRGPKSQLIQSALQQGIRLNGRKYLFEVAAMELSLLYDILYTKAAVIHTWHGLCIRIVSPLSAVAAFVLFQLSRSNKLLDACSRADVAVTYVLLVGAMAVELASSLRALGSSWACASLRNRGWHRLCGVVMDLRRMLRAGERRRACLDSLGQYNLLDICIDVSRKDVKLSGKIANLICLGGWWQKLQYSSTVPFSDDLKALLLHEIRKREIYDLRYARGTWILKQRGMYQELTPIADDAEVDRSILVWHIATDIYLSMCPAAAAASEEEKAVRDSIRVLSNHMLFLLVVHPYLVPGAVRSQRYKDTVWEMSLDDCEPNKLSRSEMVEKIHHKNPVLFNSLGLAHEMEYVPAYAYARWLASMLLQNRWRLQNVQMLEVLVGVWVEMLCYASYHSARSPTPGS